VAPVQPGVPAKTGSGSAARQSESSTIFFITDALLGSMEGER
jgi:hypothetical protein